MGPLNIKVTNVCFNVFHEMSSHKRSSYVNTTNAMKMINNTVGGAGGEPNTEIIKLRHSRQA